MSETRAALEPIDPARWYFRRAIMPWARALAAYHRTTLEGGPPPEGPCIYVALHGAGYLVLDLVVAGYFVGGRAGTSAARSRAGSVSSPPSRGSRSSSPACRP